MKTRVLSLTLVLVIALGLATPALAAGKSPKTMTVDAFDGNTDNRYTLKITNVVGVETNRIMMQDKQSSDYRPEELTVYIVSDNGAEITVTSDSPWYHDGKPAVNMYCVEYRLPDKANAMVYNSDADIAGGYYIPTTVTVPSYHEGNSPRLSYINGIWVTNESYYNKLPFAGLKMNCDGWAQLELEAAYHTGLFPGTHCDTDSGSIDPTVDDCTRAITRAEFAAVLVELACRYYDVNNTSTLSFEAAPLVDVGPDHPYSNCISIAYREGFVNGKTNITFGPDDTLTREQAAAMIARLLAGVGYTIPSVTTTGFDDDAQIRSYAKDSIAFLAGLGILNGTGNNKFTPEGNLTIQEAMLIAVRTYTEITK